VSLRSEDGPTVLQGQAPERPIAPRGPTPFWRLPWARQPTALHTRYADELRLLPSRFARIWMVLFAVFLVSLPFTVTDFWLSILNRAGIAAIAALGLNMLIGYTGQISLGHAFFLGLGAFTAAYLGGGLELPIIVWLPVAGLLGALVGLIIGPFALRLKGLYLALVTLGLVFIGEHLFFNLREITGGSQGTFIPSPMIGDLNFADLGAILPIRLTREQSFFLFLLPIVAVATLFAKNVHGSRATKAKTGYGSPPVGTLRSVPKRSVKTTIVRSGWRTTHRRPITVCL
jgi:branched-chain amino acid transport system permease protein